MIRLNLIFDILNSQQRFIDKVQEIGAFETLSKNTVPCEPRTTILASIAFITRFVSDFFVRKK